MLKQISNNYVNNNKFLTKKNIKTIIISFFLLLLYVLLDVIFISGDYNIKLYTTGIHGLCDAIAKILMQTNDEWKNNPSFNGWFVAILFGLINLLLFIFIAFPKLDFKFSINSLINTIFFVLLFFILTPLINKPNGSLNFFKNCFGLIKPNSGFRLTFIRVLIVGFFSGLIASSCIKIGSSSGGIDIIAKYLSVYKQKSISLYINILNYSIAIFSVLFVYLYKNEFNLDSLILTFVKLIINSCVIYFVLDKLDSNKKIF